MSTILWWTLWTQDRSCYVSPHQLNSTILHLCDDSINAEKHSETLEEHIRYVNKPIPVCLKEEKGGKKKHIKYFISISAFKLYENISSTK